MKSIFIPVSFLVCWCKIFSQDLKGEWKGSFTDNLGGYKTTIIFTFSKINDSTFEAFSKTFIKSNKITDSSICIMRGGFLKKNILYLEETRTIKPFSSNDTGQCMQFMKLFYYKRQKQLALKGDWFTEQNKCGYGSITLTKSYK